MAETTHDEPEEPSRLKRAMNAQTFDGLSNALFGDMVDRYEEFFEDLGEDLQKANIDTLFRTYVSRLVFITAMAFIMFVITTGVVVYITSWPIMLDVVLLFAAPSFLGLITFVAIHQYPAYRASKRAEQMENNLPFALNQMSAVSMAGSSPSDMFKLLTNFEDYQEIATEAEKINRKVQVFGEDITTAMTEVAQASPSATFKQILYGMVATIETGGDLKKFLDQRAEAALFDYKLKRKEQIEKLSTFASFYTALLVVAPLFLVVILSVMNLIGGSLLGFNIGQLMKIGVYGLIPALNLIFIVMLKITTSEF